MTKSKMSAKQLIEKLEQLGTIDAKTLRKLRKQVDESSQKISTRSIVRYLIDKRLMSREDADQLLESIASAKHPEIGQARSPWAAATRN
jgi:hypothetical protein